MTAVNLALTASDADGEALTFSATGLPGGLAINSSTGLITGTPTAAGNYNVTVTARDALASASQNFTWSLTVRDTTAPSKPTSVGRVGERAGCQSSPGARRPTTSVSPVTSSIARPMARRVRKWRALRLRVRSWTDNAFQEKVKYTYSREGL